MDRPPAVRPRDVSSLPAVEDREAFEAAIAERLTKSAHHARGALAPETLRALAKWSLAFCRWCEARGACFLPAGAETVAEFIDDLAARGRKAAGIRQGVWAIGDLHRAAGCTDPTRDQIVRHALKRIARQLGTRQRQAAPLNEEHVDRILSSAPSKATRRDRLAELRDVALALTMRDLMARRSEAVALAVEDIAFDAGGGGASVLIARSKTDQTAQGETRWLSARAAAHLRSWLDAAAISSGPVFRAVNKAGAVGGDALHPGEAARILKRLAERVGLEPATVSGHSARVGMTQDLVEDGHGLLEVMQSGRWRSPAMPARYAERALARRGAVPRYYQRRGGIS